MPVEDETVDLGGQTITGLTDTEKDELARKGLKVAVFEKLPEAQQHSIIAKKNLKKRLSGFVGDHKTGFKRGGYGGLLSLLLTAGAFNKDRISHFFSNNGDCCKEAEELYEENKELKTKNLFLQQQIELQKLILK